jgi:tetratricopeptide (TPR) repeat protein
MAKGAKKRKRSAPARTDAATPVPARRPANDDLWLMAKAAAIISLGVFIYWPALTGDWLWDDRDLVADNILIHDPNGLWKIWLQPSVMFDFLPLKISVEWIEWRLFGEETLGYHLVNLALHLTSAFLLWRFFWKFGLRFAWLGAVIFTVHPLQVESVAWMAELKNTLSLPFFITAMMAWTDFEARGRRGDYALALGMFLLAMLTKPTMVMFPFVILLYAWWRRGRVVTRDVTSSAPFFALSLAIGAATFLFLSKTTGEQHVILGGPLSRLACAGLSVAFYFSKCVLPLDLMTIYPLWDLNPPSPLQFLPWPVLAGVLWFLWSRRGGWGRHALLGLGFFLLNLVPFIGLTAGSYMNYSWVMDHLVYIPMIGLIGLAIAATGDVASKLPPGGRAAGAAILALLLALLTWASHGYASLYMNLESLWGHNVAFNPGAALPHNDLGVALARQGRIGEAVVQFRVAAELDARYTDAHHNLALELLQTGHPAEALPEFEKVAALAPNEAESHYNLALTLGELHREAEAIPEYERALALDPGDEAAYQNLAVTFVVLKRLDAAMEVLQAGLRAVPGNAQLQNTLATVQQMQKEASAPPAPKSR